MTDQEAIMLATIEQQGQAIRNLQHGMPVRAVQLLRPQPGDVILVSIPNDTKADQRRILARSWQDACGPKVRIAILPDTFSVRVIRVEDIPSESFCDNTPIIKAGDTSML